MRGRLAAALCAAVALAVVPAAAGHAELTPRGLPVGAETRVAVEIPNEREGHVTTALVLRVPAGIAVLGAEPAPGWSADRGPGSVSWRGGRIVGEESATFFVTLRADAPVGAYEVGLRQLYEDGKSVDTETAFTVIPATGAEAPKQHLGRALVAAAVGLVVVAATLLALRRARRRAART